MAATILERFQAIHPTLEPAPITKIEAGKESNRKLQSASTQQAETSNEVARDISSTSTPEDPQDSEILALVGSDPDSTLDESDPDSLSESSSTASSEDPHKQQQPIRYVDVINYKRKGDLMGDLDLPDLQHLNLRGTASNALAKGDLSLPAPCTKRGCRIHVQELAPRGALMAAVFQSSRENVRMLRHEREELELLVHEDAETGRLLRADTPEAERLHRSVLMRMDWQKRFKNVVRDKLHRP